MKVIDVQKGATVEVRLDIESRIDMMALLLSLGYQVDPATPLSE